MSKFFTCDHCGRSLPITRHVGFDEQDLCDTCFDEETACCEHCGERIWLTDNAGDNHLMLCQSCFDRSYTHCADCNELLRLDDALYEEDGGDDDPLCESCYQNHQQSATIHNYYYKPTPVFYGNADRFFGVELEIDHAGEYGDHARKILNAANGTNQLIYCKHDGSLDEGFEIVTHPMTLDFHLQQMPWNEIVQQAISMGYTSHQAGTCGLHVHVNRSSFGSKSYEQDDCIARVLYFFEKHWEELLKFSRRTESQLNRWAARYGYKDHPSEILDHAKSGYGNGRYSCINLQNTDTVEFRIFRGTLKLNTILATLQLVNRICDVAVSMSDEELKSLSWTSFVSQVTELELIQYLKERRIYINEPVTAEGEV